MSTETLDGILITEEVTLTLGDLSRACSQHAEWIMELMQEGVLEGRQQATSTAAGQRQQWCFGPRELQRAIVASRLQRDLGINLPGIALALDLMDEIDSLRAQLKREQ